MRHHFEIKGRFKDMQEAEPFQICVMGHDGRRLTLADLPSPETKRWVIRRKAEIVAAVRGGLLSLEDALSRYKLNSDEFKSWEFCIDCYGIAGLRVTQAQTYSTSISRLRKLRRRAPHYLEIMSRLNADPSSWTGPE
jgi:hypothetical protein